MIPAIEPSHVAANARLYANRYSMARTLFHGPNVAEVGVAFGDFSEFLITHLQPERFVGIDTFVLHEGMDCMGAPVGGRLGGMTHEESYRHRVPTAEVIRALSWDGLARLEDGQFDTIYLDAGHDRGSVARDTEVAIRKLAPRGILAFNDYTAFDVDPRNPGVAGGPYGVVPVVNELANTDGWKVIGFALERSMFADIALQRT